MYDPVAAWGLTAELRTAWSCPTRGDSHAILRLHDMVLVLAICSLRYRIEQNPSQDAIGRIDIKSSHVWNVGRPLHDLYRAAASIQIGHLSGIDIRPGSVSGGFMAQRLTFKGEKLVLGRFALGVWTLPYSVDRGVW